MVDLFTGCGGNAIQLAEKCKHVIAIDIDPAKIQCAKKNKEGGLKKDNFSMWRRFVNS